MKQFRLMIAGILAAVAAPVMASMTVVLTGFVYQNAIPMVIPSSGSFGTNGAVTLTTALPATYANAYLYFPANAICAGSAAGLYYTIMSSTTAGVVYNNTYSSGRPSIPTKVAYSCGTAPGGYTQSTSAVTLITFPFTAGYIGVNGQFKVYELWSYANSSSTKTLNTQFGGQNILNFSPTTTVAAEFQQWVTNRGVQNAQVLSAPSVGGFGTTGTGNTFLSVDTSTAQNLTVNGTLASASDYIVLEEMTITGLPQYN